MKGRFVRYFVYAMHFSRESNNSITNGMLHWTFRSILIFLVCGHDPRFDARVLIKVEGDDGGDVHPGFDDEEKCKLFQKIWRLTGTAGGQAVGLLSVANWEGNKKPWFEFCPIDALPVHPRAVRRALCARKFDGDLVGLRMAKGLSLAYLFPDSWIMLSLAQVLCDTPYRVRMTHKLLAQLDRPDITMQDLRATQMRLLDMTPHPEVLPIEAAQWGVTPFPPNFSRAF